MSDEYIVIENSYTDGPNVTGSPDSVNAGFKTIKAAESFILADAKSCYTVGINHGIGVELDYGSRYTIAKVVKTVKPQPTLSVKFRLEEVSE